MADFSNSTMADVQMNAMDTTGQAEAQSSIQEDAMQENSETNMDTTQFSTQEETTQQDAETTATASHGNQNMGTDKKSHRFTVHEWNKMVNLAENYILEGHPFLAVGLFLGLSRANREQLYANCVLKGIKFPTIPKYEVIKFPESVIVKLHYNSESCSNRDYFIMYREGLVTKIVPFSEEDAQMVVKNRSAE